MKPIIIDDVVDKKTQDLIENSIFSKNTQWFFSRTIFSDFTSETKRNDLMSFTKLMMDLDTKKFLNQEEELYASPIKSQNITNLFQIRAQLQLPILTEKEKVYGTPHVDGNRDIPYKVGVYYVNDSDGDTVIFKQTANYNSKTPLDVNNLDIEMTVQPKKGRLLIFDGNVYHAVGKPKKDIRCILNYHFV